MRKPQKQLKDLTRQLKLVQIWTNYTHTWLKSTTTTKDLIILTWICIPVGIGLGILLTYTTSHITTPINYILLSICVVWLVGIFLLAKKD